jgi:hypothetical protein
MPSQVTAERRRTVIDILVAFVDRLSVRCQLNVGVGCSIIGVRDA